eukprot:CAMPEP_0183374932 /NCGR_PEP_ID=MMETSP0164_2-20130417/115861_1 /TAXON_ID=221442 /ORGANISM="Coccolithus pelagicus ssp braarudi, Strain PLY182g" /LENGTH=111 /DNA_ID=CAMNT_0025552021 /DNA_START=78 /DNA_END=413 /DNA_ORIENTATION=+
MPLALRNTVANCLISAGESSATNVHYMATLLSSCKKTKLLKAHGAPFMCDHRHLPRSTHGAAFASAASSRRERHSRANAVSQRAVCVSPPKRALKRELLKEGAIELEPREE